ncbi:diguanylate cyclase [Anaerobacillus sp.]|uniref:diguanylate cyclase n=1 Tax=Anaerobacillus sp. TaxID=1872506 RepID=UPI003919D230
MKRLVKQAYQSDHGLEIIFSSLRWLFLLLSILVFYIQYKSNPVDLYLYLFITLVIFGFIYMALSDLCLHLTPENSFVYNTMTKGGPFFDYISYFALIALTGGIYSPLIPIAYLIILHVTVYWKFIGGMIASLLFMVGYTIVFMIQASNKLSYDYMTYSTQLVFLLLIGFLGGIVVSRERQLFTEKNVLENLANKDHLTNLHNHRSFQEQLRVSKEKNLVFYLVFADIDEFKKINDKYGHVVGDLVLKKIAKVLSTNIPQNVGTVYRYGGEEFAILLFTDQYCLVERLLENLKLKISEEVHYCHGGKFSVTMSFGCSKNGSEEPIQLIEEADRLLYEAKRQGRNRIIHKQELKSG